MNFETTADNQAKDQDAPLKIQMCFPSTIPEALMVGVAITAHDQMGSAPTIFFDLDYEQASSLSTWLRRAVLEMEMRGYENLTGKYRVTALTKEQG